MIGRRIVLSSLLATLAAPAFAQANRRSLTDDSVSTVDDPVNIANVGGQYISQGRYSNGEKFEGVAKVTRLGRNVDITWRVEGNQFSGKGTIAGRVITVEWGAETPILYVIMPDGSLHGTYNDGTALEKLTPR